MLIHGGCHCGNIRFELDWQPEPEPEPDHIPARACDCAFCTKHGGVWTSNPAGVLRVRVRDAARVTPYVFGTRTATFHVCAECGNVPLVTSEVEGRLRAVVNVNAFDNVAAALLRPASASFDGESLDQRLARRARNWIADVRFEHAGAAGARSGEA